MSKYWFLYDMNGTIYPNLSDKAPNAVEMGILGPWEQDSAPVDVVMAYTYPNRYVVQNGQLAPYPYFTLSATESAITSGEWTFSATLNNVPAPTPVTCTFATLGQTFTGNIANNTAVFTIKVHPSVADTSISVSVSADGCSSATATIGSSPPQVGLQIFTPSSEVPNVVPSGVGSRDFLSAYYALSPASLTTLLGDMGTAISLLYHTVYGVLLPAATSASYQPVALDADQNNVLQDVRANLLPSLFTTLSNAFPSGGQRQLQFNDFVMDMQKSFNAFEKYMADLQTIPNLM